MCSTKLTKSKLTEMLSLYNSASKISRCNLWYKDMIYPVCLYYEDKLEQWSFGTDGLIGTHLMQNTLIELNDEYGYLSDPASIDLIKLELKKVGIQHIEMINDSYGTGYHIRIIDREGNDNTFRLFARIDINDKVIQSHLYNSFDNRWDYLLSLGINYDVKTDDIINIISGYRTVLRGEISCKDTNFDTSVRVSKNLFPLLGPVKKSDRDAMKITYTLLDINGSGPVVVLAVKYKKMQALHLYSFIHY